MKQRMVFYKDVSDDWYPNYKISTKNHPTHFHGDVVCVTKTLLGPKGDSWRVHVWGADDCGMEYDSADEAEVENLFTEIALLPHPLSAAWLTGKGFVRA